MRHSQLPQNGVQIAKFVIFRKNFDQKPLKVYYKGLVLGPILFLLYTEDLLQLVKSHHLNPHAFADDTQIDGFCNPSDAAELTSQLSVCIDDVSCWMVANRLQLNPIKSEVLCCSSARRQHQIPTGPVRIGSISVQPVSAVRDLGVFIHADLSTSP